MMVFLQAADGWCVQQYSNMSNNPFPRPNGYMPPYSPFILPTNHDQNQLRTSIESNIALEPEPTNPLGDGFNMDSFRTLSRGSLHLPTENQLLEASAREINVEEEEVRTPKLASSRSSAFFEEEDVEKEFLQVMGYAGRLSLDASGKERKEESEESDGNFMKKKGKNRWIKDARRLVRQLKRQYKYSDGIVADWVLQAEGKRESVNSARVEPIRADNQRLQGLLIQGKDQTIKIKVRNRGEEHYEPVLEWWLEDWGWTECSFKARLHNV